MKLACMETGTALLDQGTDVARAKADLDWSPSHPGLVDEYRNGSYRKQATNA